DSVDFIDRYKIELSGAFSRTDVERNFSGHIGAKRMTKIASNTKAIIAERSAKAPPVTIKLRFFFFGLQKRLRRLKNHGRIGYTWSRCSDRRLSINFGR